MHGIHYAGEHRPAQRGTGIVLSILVHAIALILYLRLNDADQAQPADASVPVTMIKIEPPPPPPATLEAVKKSPASPPAAPEPKPRTEKLPPPPPPPSPIPPLATQPAPAAAPVQPVATAPAPVASGASTAGAGVARGPSAAGGLPDSTSDIASWIRKPTSSDWAIYYPRRARSLTSDAHIMLSCRVTTQNKVRDCKILSEKPRGYGLGEAVVAMSYRFRVRPMVINGQPRYDVRVRIPLVLAVPN